jgi:nitroreductase
MASRTLDRVIRAEHVDVLLGAAGLAPSLHNSQPWQFAVGSSHVEVYANPSQQLRNADPTGRALLISCGAAVFNLRVAAAHLGYRPRPRLMPAPSDQTLIATLDFERRRGAAELSRLYDAVPARRTNRQPFEERSLPPSVRATLGDAARVEGALLTVFDDPEEVSRIGDLLRDADVLERTEPARIVERARWIGDERQEERAGIPSESIGPRPLQLGSPFRDLGGPGGRRDHAAFERAPTLAVLSTKSDKEIDWVRAGQALERVLLEATAAGISASFMNQPLEQDDLRWQVRNPLTGVGHAQMILRLGYGDPVPATPRRPVQEIRREPHLQG